LLCVDIEPAPEPRHGLPVVMVQTVLETFQRASTRSELCELAVQGLKALTGYDRVMAYRFTDTGDGEVIAEACNAGVEPYLGLRYPASDIPRQARRLYLRQRVGVIVDSNYRPVPLLVHPTLHDGAPLDMTHCSLRSVSPVHLEYMRNMRTAASLTIGLAHQQELWGMLVCHHATPRSAGPELRAAADMIGQVVSLLLSSLGNSEEFALRIERAGTLRALIEKLSTPVSLLEAFAAAEADLLKLVSAGGALVRLSGSVRGFGRTPPETAAEQALSVLHQAASGEIMAVDDLGLRYPELAECTHEGSGALLLPLSQAAGDAILWFRPELSRNVTWGGDPHKLASPDPLTGRISPRHSFAAWKEIVRGCSAPWLDADVALVAELRTAIELELAQRTKAELARLRNYDALTGLPNRRLLEGRLAEVNEYPAADSVALLFLDLDRFKAVNDTLGHAAGDALLVQVAARLVGVAGPDNLVARLGGDEFVVLCQNLPAQAVAALGEQIRLAIEAPFEISGFPCHISVSIGIAYADELGGLDLLRAADMAMYAAKKSGGNQGMAFEQSLYDRAARRFELEHDLREALGRDDQLLLVYQPIFNAPPLKDVVGFEARLRWLHPRDGWLAPDLFIPLAEKLGLMAALGNWVLTEALRQGERFRQLCPGRVLRMSVNISPQQLARAEFSAELETLLQSVGFPAASLCLEVTESALSDAGAIAVITQARELRCLVALDDFGMGQSSLSHLRRLPVDIVKLDRSFLEPGEGDFRVASFIGAVTNLVHAAGLSVIAKGVETPAQLAAAAEAGVDNVQGFLLAPPLSAKAAAALLVQANTPPPLEGGGWGEGLAAACSDPSP
jgi:diguanylate cyclase (GGDEF)-like protein